MFPLYLPNARIRKGLEYKQMIAAEGLEASVNIVIWFTLACTALIIMQIIIEFKEELWNK